MPSVGWMQKKLINCLDVAASLKHSEPQWVQLVQNEVSRAKVSRYTAREGPKAKGGKRNGFLIFSGRQVIRIAALCRETRKGNV